jgi:two-component system alkaline phosphatase synthesis response regulator PhoP
MADSNGSNGHKRKVLIVDDEDMTRVLLVHVFERMRVKGLQILMAEDGEEALKIAADERPDLILLDVLLPKLNGYDGGNSTDRQRAEAIGANDFMTKPFNPSRLMGQLGDIWGL